MSWKFSTEEYRGFTIAIQVCTNPELEEGDIVTIEHKGEEERFESVDECKRYIDELHDERIPPFTHMDMRREWGTLGR